MVTDFASKNYDTPQRASSLQPASGRRAALDYQSDADWQFYSVLPINHVWYGVVLAAACYPVVFGLFLLVFFGLPFGFQVLTVKLSAMLLWGSVFCFIFGLLGGIVVSVPAYFVTRFLRWSLQGVISERGVSGMYGGMVGFLLVSGGGLFVGWTTAMRNMDACLLYAFAFLLAIVMGHFGAICAGYRKQKAGFPFF